MRILRFSPTLCRFLQARRLCGVGFVVLSVACTPTPSGSNTESETADPGSASSSGSSGTSTSAGEETTGTTAAESSTAGTGLDSTTESTSTSGTTTEGTSTSGSTTEDRTTTAGLECDPGDLPECALDSCVQSWSYSCDECEIEFDRPRCFEADVGCGFPALSCDLPKPCERVWGFGQENLESLEMFESEKAALCVLTSLADGSAAHHEILWGDMNDAGVTVLDAFVDGAGGVTVQWEVDCQGCPTSGRFGRTGRLELQGAAFFAECLDSPDTAKLIECLYGFTEFSEGSGPEDGYTPPWTTGECSALEFKCPG